MTRPPDPLARLTRQLQVFEEILTDILEGRAYRSHPHWARVEYADYCQRKCQEFRVRIRWLLTRN